jgi:ABC-type phosphate transport system substrate-binding protein
MRAADRTRLRRAGWLLGAVATLAAVLAVSSPHVSWGDTGTTLSGEGGSFAEPMMNVLQQDPTALAAIAPFAPSYFVPTVDVALQDFASGATDYAVSEFPLTADDAATAAKNGRTFAYVPFAASPVAIAAVVVCQESAQFTSSTLCANLKLTVPLLAQIFATVPPGYGGSPGIDFWNNAALSALSPSLKGVASPSAAIIPQEDVNPAATSYALESLFLTDPAAKATWDAYLKLYTGSTDDAPSEFWPHTSSSTSGGDQALAQALIPVDETAKPPTVAGPETWGQGAIAALPMDWTGAPRNIPTVAIQNAAGDFVSPTVASMTAALGHATMDPKTNLVTFNANASDAAAYPIPVMSYLVVPTSGLGQATATALANFIKFVLGKTGQDEVAAQGAAPVTQAMVTAGLQVAAEVAAQSGSSGSTTTTSTSTTSTTTTATTRPTTSTSTSTTAPHATATADQGSSGTGSGAGGSPSATNASSSGSNGPNGGPSLASTGGVSWLPGAVGSAMVLLGLATRRLLRARVADGSG